MPYTPPLNLLALVHQVLSVLFHAWSGLDSIVTGFFCPLAVMVA